MKRTFLIIICSVAIFALGYTAYAATIKNSEKKALSKNPKDIQERVTNLRNQQINNFSDKNAKLLSLVDKEMLLSATSTQTRGINNPNILLTSKINFLNMYFNFTKKNNKISNEFVHKIVIATSTKAIQDTQKDFFETNILHLKKSLRKTKTINLHQAIHIKKVEKPTIATPIPATTTEEIIPIATTTEATTTEPVDEVISTTTETQ